MASPHGHVPNGNIKKVLNDLTEFEYDKFRNKWKFKYAYYLFNENTQRLVLPRQLLRNVIECLKSQCLPYNLNYPKLHRVKDIHATIRPEWNDRPEHGKVIAHLSNAQHSMRASNLQTGKGKTYCALRSLCNLHKRTLIVCDGLVEQWVDEIHEKTLIPEDQVYVLKGSASVIQALKFTKKEHPSVFVASLDTLMPYVLGQGVYQDIDPWSKFVSKFYFGTKIIDEFHLNMQALINLDLRTNIPNNIYLSATPKRSKKSEARIFDIIFPRYMIVGGETYDKYVHVKFFRYDLHTPKPGVFKTIHGYSHTKYEGFLVNNSMAQAVILNDILFPLISTEFIKIRRPEQKLLIFGSTIVFCQLLQRKIQQQYPELNVKTFVSGDPLEHLEADIIVGTPKSCGTGKDIPNLRTVINTTSLSSPPTVEQMLGRLRKLKTEDTPIYVDMYNASLERQRAHYHDRKNIYRLKAKTYTEHTI
jgi:hypothetical protein